MPLCGSYNTQFSLRLNLIQDSSVSVTYDRDGKPRRESDCVRDWTTDRRDGVVVRVSASLSVDLGFIP